VPHTITVPDDLWEAAGRSPMALRNQLYVAFLRHQLDVAEATGSARQEGKRVEALPVPNGGPSLDRTWGTLFIARDETVCPACGEKVRPWDFAIMTDWTTGLGKSSKAVHARCAEREGITMRWSARKLNSCFRWLSQRPGIERVS
jgi:hypothetical protein